MIFELAIVQDQGSYWVVTNVTKNTLDNLANRDEQILKLSYVTYKMISEALLEGKQVRVNKKLVTDEVLPHEIQILNTTEQTDPLQAVKDASVVRLRMLVTPTISKIAGLTMYSFIILNNDLANAGYFITDKNREETYLSILETGDETLIQKLEDYLNFRDEIEKVAFFERRFTAFRSAVKEATTADDVAKLEESFTERFYAVM